MTGFFKGTRGDDGAAVHIHGDGRVRRLPPRLDIWSHSPTGLEWGYGGSGPAQLALALLIAVGCPHETACELHQAFKWDVVAKLPKCGWELTVQQVLSWWHEHDQHREDLAAGKDPEEDEIDLAAGALDDLGDGD